MKKIWIGGYGACLVHNVKWMITSYIENHGFELTEIVEEADLIIVTDTCLSTWNNFLYSIEYIKEILKRKKESTEVVVSGCFSKGVKFELTEEQKELLSKITIVKEKNLVDYIVTLLTKENVPDSLDIPFSIYEYSITVSPVIGCLNHCAFCKSHYLNFNLESYPFKSVKELTEDIETNNYPFHHIAIHSSNLSLYGFDLYRKRRAHEVIEMFTRPDKIKFAYVGCLINWYPELVEEIIRNSKIKEIFISLESGSERVYKLMNRPISLENLIRLIRFIKKERPDIIIHTEFIAGFPTETIDDLKKSIALAYELDVFPAFLWPYENSEQIPASKLQEYSMSYCLEATNYINRELQPLQEKFKNRILSGEMLVVDKLEKTGLYVALLANGILKNVRFDQLDRDYQEGEIIPANTVKPKQLVKRKL